MLIGLAAPFLLSRRAQAMRVIGMVSGAPAGSSGDEIARAFADHLGRHLGGTEIAVRNIPGEGGLAALRALANAQPSGATIGWVTTPALPARVVDRGESGLPERLTLLGAVEREPIAFVSTAANPLESVRDIIQRSSEDAGAIPFGTPPPGSPPHLAVLRLQAMTQTRLNIVAFPSAAAARQAVLAGNVSAAALGLADAIVALRADKLVGLGIAARKRSGILPDLPVLSEAGVPLSAWIRRGVAVPAGMRAEIAAPLIAALHAIATDAAFIEQSEAAGVLAYWSDGAGWTAQMERERAELDALWALDPWLNTAGQ